MYSPLPLNETRNKATESLRTALEEGQDPWRSLAQVVGIYVLKSVSVHSLLVKGLETHEGKSNDNVHA